MKKIELLAESSKTATLLGNSDYFTYELSGRFGEVRRMNFTDEDMKEAFDNDLKLLKKIDAINNALFESDAKEYIEVMGNRLSVATARKYLDEIHEDILTDDKRDEFEDVGKEKVVSPGTNLRAMMFDRCIVHEFERVDKDPLDLKNRAAEFRKKILDWYYGLKVAVSVSDSTTEIECPYLNM